MDKQKQAEEYRINARECERAGYGTIATVNWQMARLLDPPPAVTRERHVRAQSEDEDNRPGNLPGVSTLGLGKRKPMRRADLGLGINGPRKVDRIVPNRAVQAS